MADDDALEDPSGFECTRWPGCAEPVAISADGGATWSCWEHVTDDFLPAVEHGVIGACALCHSSTVQWIVRWPESPDLPIHDHCRYRYFRAIAEEEGALVAGVDELAAAPAADVEPRGAYRRREA